MFQTVCMGSCVARDCAPLLYATALTSPSACMTVVGILQFHRCGELPPQSRSDNTDQQLAQQVAIRCCPGPHKVAARRCSRTTAASLQDTQDVPDFKGPHSRPTELSSPSQRCAKSPLRQQTKRPLTSPWKPICHTFHDRSGHLDQLSHAPSASVLWTVSKLCTASSMRWCGIASSCASCMVPCAGHSTDIAFVGALHKI